MNPIKQQILQRPRKEAAGLWYPAPPADDGELDHSLLEQVLKLAIAVARRQVVFE